MSDYDRELEELVQHWDVSITFEPRTDGKRYSVTVTPRPGTQVAFYDSGMAYTYRGSTVSSAVLLACAGGPSCT